MDKQSNSRFYHGDCRCKKSNTPTRVVIECEECIVDDPLRYENNRRGYVCNCVDVEIIREICETCALERDKMYDLMNTLDDLMYDLNYNIKQYENCEEKIKEISEISKKLRHLNRKLLSRVVKSNEKEKSEKAVVEEEYEEESETNKWELEEDNTDWTIPLPMNEICKHNM